MQSQVRKTVTEQWRWLTCQRREKSLPESGPHLFEIAMKCLEIDESMRQNAALR
jgi:hypothetical protein